MFGFEKRVSILFYGIHLVALLFSGHAYSGDTWTVRFDCFTSIHKTNNGSNDPLKVSIVRANGEVLHSQEVAIPNEDCKLEVSPKIKTWYGPMLSYSEEKTPVAGFTADHRSGRSQIVRVEATGNDAVFLDRVLLSQFCSTLRPEDNCGGFDRQWGSDGGSGWCLSTDPNDSFGGRQTTPCLRCVEFAPDGSTHGCNNTSQAHARHVLRGVESQRCVAMGNGKAAKPVAVHCNRNTKVELNRVKQGRVQIKYSNAGKCLFHSKNKSFGFYRCNSAYNDQWWQKINQKPDGSFQLKNAVTGQCLFSDMGGRLGTFSCKASYSDQFFTTH